jgi:hypothetical protein
MYLIGHVDDDGDGICTSHQIPKQRVTGASVLPDSNVDNVVCWLHSHHGMGAWHSGTDREHANYPFIATVSLQQGKFDISAKKRFMLPCCQKYMLIDTNVQFFMSDNEEEAVAERNINDRIAVAPGGQITIGYPQHELGTNWGYIYHDTIPKDKDKFNKEGAKCRFGLEKDGCRWQCRAATRKYHDNGSDFFFCDEARASSIAAEKTKSSTSILLHPPVPMSSGRESEQEAERIDNFPNRPFADAALDTEALAVLSIANKPVVPVEVGEVCQAKGYSCHIGCRHALMTKTLKSGMNVVFCTRKAEERRNEALQIAYAEDLTHVDETPPPGISNGLGADFPSEAD